MQDYQHLNEVIQGDIVKYMHENGRTAGKQFLFKSIFLLALWVSLYMIIVFYQPDSKLLMYGLSILWGICSLFIVFNIGHDAVHQVITDKKGGNNFLQYTFNLVGGNAYSWKLKHNIAHHVHTNIEGKDFDTDLSPLMRLSPESPFQRPYRWQHLSVFLIYPLLSLLILFIGDFKIFFQTKNAGLVKHHPIREWIILIATKIYYIFLIVVIPFSFGAFSLTEILLTFLSFQILNGIIISLVFMPSHYFPGSHYFKQRPEDYNWLRHQISTTMDLSPNSYLISMLLGGLNLNISHHLNSRFCHTHYYQLSKIIKKRLFQYDVPYNEMTYPNALVAHYKYIASLRHDRD